MLVDANLLLYAVDESSPQHAAAHAWLSTVLNGDRRVGMPWESLTAFVRITTNPRAFRTPLSPAESWGYVEDWLAAEVVWQPLPSRRHGEILGRLVTSRGMTANLVPDAHLAAIALGHGLTVYSADSDFAIFAPELRWSNPLAQPTPA